MFGVFYVLIFKRSPCNVFHRVFRDTMKRHLLDQGFYITDYTRVVPLNRRVYSYGASLVTVDDVKCGFHYSAILILRPPTRCAIRALESVLETFV